MTDISHNLTPEEIDAAFLPEPLRDEKVMRAHIPGPPEMAFMSLIGDPVLAPTIPPILKPLPPENDLTQLITSSDTQHTKEVAGPPPLTKEEKKALAALKKEQLAAARALKQEIKRAEEEAEAARLEELARRGIQEGRLAAHHVADWLAHHRHIQTEDQWIEWVCNNPTVINQKKQGNCLHFPCHNIPDSYWDPVVFGWKPRPYLLVLPSPTTVDMAGKTGLSMNDQVSAFLRFELESAGIALEDCQVTYACRFALPAGSTSYNAGHKDSCAPYLQADVEHCRPRVVLTFGSDALKGLLGEHGKLATYRGEVADWRGFPIVMTQTCKEFMSGYGGIEVFRAELRRARDVAQGNYRPARLDQSGYRVVDSVEKMRELLGEVEAAQPKHLAFDFEFGSRVRREEYTVDRSCQVSWAAGRAAFIKLLGPKGEPIYSMEDYAEMVRLLGVLLGDPRWRLDGHHARVDFNRAWRLGIGMDDKLSTAFCTLLVFHLLHGDDDLGLDQLCRRYIPEAGSYWRDLELWLDSNGRTKQLEQGYLNVPDEILIPYGLADADVTWRIAEKLEEELKAQPALWNLYWNISAPAALHIMDVERQGLRVDDVQRMRLRGIIEPEYRAILSEFRELVNWPEFDPAKREQIASYLYSGTHYKDKKVAPPGVRVLDLQPPFNTDKYPREWVDIEAAQENHLHSPSTKSTAIDLLATEHPEEVTLKYLKFMSCLGKFLNTYLTRVEYADPQPDEELVAQYGYPFQYPWGPAVAPLGLPREGDGFAANICDDGRVRGHIHQTSETGRWRMTKPNLQTCVTGDHEVLTPKGWVRFDQLEDGVQVMQWAPDGKLTFVVPSVTRIEHTGKLVRLEGEHISKVMTPNHRVPVFTKGAPKALQVREAQELVQKRRDLLLPCAGVYEGPGLPLAEAEIRLLVAMQADGSYSHADRGVDFSFHKKRKYLRLLELLEAAGIPYRDYTKEQPAGWTRYRVYVKDDRMLGFCDAYLGDKKRFDFEFLFKLSQVQLQAFVEELPNWDGLSTRQSEYFSSIETNTDVAVVASTLVSRRAYKRLTLNSSFADPNGQGSPHQMYVSSMAQPGRDRNWLTSVDCRLVGTDTDVTPVYCVTVPTSFFLVRHKNKISVTGNSPKKQETSLLEAFVFRRFGGMDIQEYFRRTNDKKAPKDLIPVEQRIELPGFKSIYVPDEGNCLIEVDFKTAEICVWAYCSEDPVLTAMIEQGRDIHCETATMCFNLPVADELKEALAELNGGKSKEGDKYDIWAKKVKVTYEALRTVAKAVLFGLVYGRGAAALSREINKQGVETTVEACQGIIDGIAKNYPKAWQWLKERQAEAIEEGRVTNSFGFRRYFSGASMLSNKEQAKIKRQAGNAAVQGTVGQLLNVAGTNLYRLMYKTPIGKQVPFKILLGIHDAYIVECKIEHFDQVNRILGMCMSTLNKIPGTSKTLGVDFPKRPMMTAADH